MIVARCRRAATHVAVVGSLLLLLPGCAPQATSARDDGQIAVGTADGRPDGSTGSTLGPTEGVARPAAAAVRRYRSVRAHETVALPIRITMPAIGVSSSLQRLGRDADGAIEVPDDWHEAGWYADGPKPGQVGPAVILGHVDSKSGPAVFFRLRELRAGDEVRVTRADGSVATFVVQRTERHAKTRFPTHDVYLPTLQPTLRLVTCGGAFDAASGHYRDNVVVFARLAQ